jgi:hypothetical protein
MPREPIEFDPELAALLRRLSLTYCWDMKPEDALLQALRVLRRSMDFAVWDDVLAMEAIVGKPLLTEALKTAPMGAMRPKSWSFWHVRLGLRGPDGEIPPEPSDRFAEPEE